MAAHELLGGVREEAGDLLLLGVAGHPDHELTEGVVAHTARQGGEGIDRHPRRFELADLRLDDLQVILKARGFGIGANDLEQPVLLHLLEVDAPAGAVAQQLSPRFLIGKQDRAFLVAAGVFDEFGDEHRLARSGGAGGQDDRVLEETSAAHVVQARHAGTDPDVG